MVAGFDPSHPNLATVKERLLSTDGLRYRCPNSLMWMKSSCLFILLPFVTRGLVSSNLALGEPVVPRSVWVLAVKLSKFLQTSY